MGVYEIRMTIQSVEKEIYDLEYSLNKEKIRKHSSNVFILIENIVKELVYIYSYLLYGSNYNKDLNKYKNMDKLMFGQALKKLKENSISPSIQTKNTQWYIFRNFNIQTLIPVKNKIGTLNNDTIEPKTINLRKENTQTEHSLGYLKIDGETETIEVRASKTFIGRLVTNDIQLTNRSISRRHCLIEVIDRYVYIIDLDSKFGTYVNDIKLVERERTLLKNNDEIIIGKGIEKVKIIYKN